MAKSLEQRFWPHVDRRGADECWLWKGSLAKGYPVCRLSATRQGRGHRVSWILAFGPIPDGLCVLHKCDTPACVNPGHLFLGTLNDNNQDMKGKARHAHGDRHGCAKLSWEEVDHIRRLYNSGVKSPELSRVFGVTVSAICYILRGDKWQR